MNRKEDHPALLSFSTRSESKRIFNSPTPLKKYLAQQEVRVGEFSDDFIQQEVQVSEFFDEFFSTITTRSESKSIF